MAAIWAVFEGPTSVSLQILPARQHLSYGDESQKNQNVPWWKQYILKMKWYPLLASWPAIKLCQTVRKATATEKCAAAEAR